MPLGYDEAWSEGDDGVEPELITPEDFLPPSPFPIDAQRMGFDRYTGDNGALLAFAAALDGSKSSHRAMAWLMLVTVALPAMITAWSLVRLV